MLANTDPMIKRLILNADINAGMRILDVGCGNGPISLLLAEIVGQSGEVIGIDYDHKSLSVARRRAKEHKLSNISFVQHDLSQPLPKLNVFDAAVGRRILMYLPNPTDTIHYISKVISSGGFFVFQESDATMVPGSLETLPLHDQVNDWILQTVNREGGNVQIGFKLPIIIERAGLKIKHICAEAAIEGQNTYLEPIVRAMLPRIIEQGVASETEIDLETLEERLKEERSPYEVYVRDMNVGILAKKP